MSDLIERQALIHIAEREAKAMNEPFKSNLPVLVEWLAEKIPAEEPERKTGQWIQGTNHGLGVYNYTCSECSHTIVTDDAYNYCPHCGSQNRGAEGE